MKMMGKFWILVIAAVVVLVALIQHPCRIAFYRYRMDSLWHRILETGFGIEAYDANRDALVSLRYLKHKTFPLTAMKFGSKQYHALLDALRSG